MDGQRRRRVHGQTSALDQEQLVVLTQVVWEDLLLDLHRVVPGRYCPTRIAPRHLTGCILKGDRLRLH